MDVESTHCLVFSLCPSLPSFPFHPLAPPLTVAVVLHVILFLLLMCVFGCFLLLIFLPLLRRMDKEVRACK